MFKVEPNYESMTTKVLHVHLINTSLIQVWLNEKVLVRIFEKDDDRPKWPFLTKAPLLAGKLALCLASNQRWRLCQKVWPTSERGVDGERGRALGSLTGKFFK